MTSQLVLAATNMVMGPANFGSLELPDEWSLGSGVSPPEVDRSRGWGGVDWVIQGRADWILRRADGALNVELTVRVVPRRADGAPPEPPAWIPSSAAAIEVSGHDARTWQGGGRRGLLPRREVSWVRSWVPCTHTGREIVVEVVGACAPSDLAPLGPLLERLRCH